MSRLVTVYHDVDSAELPDGSLDCCLCILWAGDIEFHCQQVVLVAHRGCNLRSIAAGGDNGMAGGQGGLGDVDAQASASTQIWLFLISFALVFYGMGASFVESFLNYPTWRLIGANEFRAYHQALGPLVIGYMVIPMLITTLLTVLLLRFRPTPIPRWAIWLAVVLQLIIWVSTATIQLPIQVQLSRDGLSLPLINRLIFTNWWLRKVPQIINSFLFLWMMSLLLRVNSHQRRSITTHSTGAE